MLSKYTYKVVGYGYVSRLTSDEVIDWALDMLDLNYIDNSLYILASISKGSPFYEVEPYLAKAIENLGLKRRENNEAILSYSRFYVNEIVNGNNIRLNIKTLSDITIHEGYIDELMVFYNLNFSWLDLEYDPNHQSSHYYEKVVNLSNIEKCCIMESKKWLELYLKSYVQNDCK